MPENDFLNWFAGLVDGEGSFDVAKYSNGSYGARFRLALRADDYPILLEIKDKLGIGAISFSKETFPSKPQAIYQVQSKKETQLLCTYLSGRLRAKKARDFLIWSSVVEILKAIYRGQRVSGNYSLEVVKSLKEELSKMKTYDETRAPLRLVVNAD